MTKMLLKDILIVVLITSLSQQIMAQNKSFCKTFADNDFEIDHNLNRLLIIGSDYWWRTMDDSSGNLSHNLSSFSERSDIFDNRYNALIEKRIRVIDKNIGLIGRLYENNTIQWIPYYFSGIGISKRDDFKVIKNTRMDFEPDFKPTLIFEFEFRIHLMYVFSHCFLQQNQLTSNRFERKFRCFQFINNEGNVISYRILTDNELRDSGLGLNYSNVNTIEDRKVIAVFDNWFYFKENKTIITYCTTKSGPFYDGCKQTEVMINCSQFLKIIPKSIWEWMAWILVVIIGVLLTAFCVLYFYCYSDKANIFVGEDEEQSIGNQKTTSKQPEVSSNPNIPPEPPQSPLPARGQSEDSLNIDLSLAD